MHGSVKSGARSADANGGARWLCGWALGAGSCVHTDYFSGSSTAGQSHYCAKRGETHYFARKLLAIGGASRLNEFDNSPPAPRPPEVPPMSSQSFSSRRTFLTRAAAAPDRRKFDPGTSPLLHAADRPRPPLVVAR